MRKFLIIMLLLASVLITAGFAPAEASYWEGMKEMYEWDGLEGNSEVDVIVAMPDLNLHYQVKMYSKSNLNDFISYSEIEVVDMAGLQEIPKIKMFTNGSDVYFSSDAVKALLSTFGLDGVIDVQEEYILLKSNTSNFQIDSNFMVEMVKFLEEMDLGIELDMIKSGNTYTLELDSDKIIDLFDAYIKYVITNMDKFPVGIVPEDLSLSQEELEEVLNQYDNMIAPQLQMLKGLVTGSYYKQVSVFEEDKYDEDAELFIISPMMPDMNINIKTSSTTTKLDGADIKLPTSVFVITEEEFNNLIMSHFAQDNLNGLTAVIDLQGNYVKFGAEKVEDGKINLVVQDGKAYITSEELSELIDVSFEGAPESIWIRELNNFGYFVNWNEMNNTIEIYQ